MSGKMNPNASQFSPSALAMIKHDGAVNASDFENCPRDLVVHESLKHLIQEVQELKLRATNLEDENTQLRGENEQFKLQLSSLKKAFANGSAAPAVGTNLTGYVASDTSSTGMLKGHVRRCDVADNPYRSQRKRSISRQCYRKRQ
jgi:hypothetical protein